MNLTAQRPSHWNDVVGQQRAIGVLQAVLKNPSFLTPGILLYGVLGVGKTTVAYLTARALMCTGKDPLGCGTCPSCELVAQSGIDSHPDFQEVDGAQKSGIAAAQEIVEATLSLPVLGRRRVLVIDEVQFLSPEAWGAYLKVLERGDTDSIFIFVSNEVEKIKKTATSRCTKIPFERVANSALVGLLSKIATDNDIPYELDGLELMARHSKGIIRDAVQWLNTAAVLGKIEPGLVKRVLDSSLEDKCMKMLISVARKDQVGAVKLADEIGLNFSPQRAIETMLSIYGRSIWQDDSESESRQIYVGLPSVGAVTDILIKWSGLAVPADVMTIVVYELLQTQQQSARPARTSVPIVAPVAKQPSRAAVQAPKSSLAAFLDGEVI